MSRSLNSVQLIGNLTRDPELRYTPSGAPVTTVGLATNRTYKTQSGEQKEEAEFHRLVLWNKLAEIASQYLTKGAKIYIEGRLSTRQWTAQDGTQRQTTEIIVNDMVMLGGRRGDSLPDVPVPTHAAEPAAPVKPAQADKGGGESAPKTQEKQKPPTDDLSPDDVPF